MDDQGARIEGEDLPAQRRRLEEVFAGGWVAPARGPVTFNADDLSRIEQVHQHGGLLSGQEHEYLQWLRAGGRRGDPLPAAPATRRPFITGVSDDFELRIARTGDRAHVELLFSHERFPAVRFGHRFPPPDEADGYEDIWLMEEVETGGLDRLMQKHPSPGDDGIIWTDWLSAGSQARLAR